MKQNILIFAAMSVSVSVFGQLAQRQGGAQPAEQGKDQGGTQGIAALGDQQGGAQGGASQDQSQVVHTQAAEEVHDRTEGQQ